jgi:transposase
MPGPIKIGFEATGGQESALWATFVAAEIDAGQLPPALIKAFALSWGTRAKTDRIDAELSARFMLFRPEAGRRLPTANLRILRALTTRRTQTVDMRKRLWAQIAARKKQAIPADVESMDADHRTMLDTQVGDLERRIESVIAQEETSAAKARLLRSIPGSGLVSAVMMIAEMPELGRMTSGEAAGMTGLAPVPHDSGAMRGRHTIAGGRRSFRHILFQTVLAAACNNPVLKFVAKHLKMSGKPHNSPSPAGWSPSQTRSWKRASHENKTRSRKHSCWTTWSRSNLTLNSSQDATVHRCRLRCSNNTKQRTLADID